MKKLILSILILSKGLFMESGSLAMAQEPIIITNETEINSIFQEYSPAFYQNGLVFIASNPSVNTDKKEDDNTGKATTSLFFAARNDNGSLQKPLTFAEELSTKFYDGPLSFSKDGNTIYFTRTNLRRGKPIKAKDGLVKLKIYTATKKDNKWVNIFELPFNNSEYDCAHPSVSNDGRRLYFSSNRPGGFGGMDLYVSTLINGKWSDPVNLGPKVNTDKNEIFPFIHADGKVYFASNGHKGIGNLDIFCTMKTDTGWLKPHNLPEPINSRSDDFGLIVSGDKKSGFFSSNRASGKGDDDIFTFSAQDGIDFQNTVVNSEVIAQNNQNASDNTIASVSPQEVEIKIEPELSNILSNGVAKTDNNPTPVVQLEKIEVVKPPLLETVKPDIKTVEAKSVSIAKTETIASATEPIFDDTPSNIEKNKIETPSNEPLKKFSEPKGETLKSEFEETDLKAVVGKKEVKIEVKPTIEKVDEKKQPIETVEKNDKKTEAKSIKDNKQKAKEANAVIEKMEVQPEVKPAVEKVEEKQEPVVVAVVEKKEVKSVIVKVEEKQESITAAIVEKKEDKSEVKPAIEKIEEKQEPIAVTVVEKKDHKPEMIPATEKTAVVEVKPEPLVAKVDSMATASVNIANGKIRNKYLVVVGTYAIQENAVIQKKIAVKKGFQDVEIIHYTDNHLYGVCVRQCSDEKEAQALVHSINKERNMEAFVKILK